MCELPQWSPPREAAVVVAPHPDDETLGAGALIATLRAQGVPVTVVAATDGENADDTEPAQRRLLGSVRDEEQREALARLGVPASGIHRLRLPDSGLMASVAELTQRLLPLVSRQTHLIAPWIGDFHPDHVACAQAAQTVQASTGCRLTFYFFWTWHRGTPDLLQGLAARRFAPGPAALQAKGEAIRCHHSQLHYTGDEGSILPERLLEPAFWPCEIFLPHDEREALPL